MPRTSACRVAAGKLWRSRGKLNYSWKQPWLLLWACGFFFPLVFSILPIRQRCLVLWRRYHMHNFVISLINVFIFVSLSKFKFLTTFSLLKMIIYLAWNLYSVIFFLALCDFSLSLPEIASWLQTINFEIVFCLAHVADSLSVCLCLYFCIY